MMSFEDLQPFNVASCSVINLVCPILFIHDGRIDAVDRNTWRKKDYHTTCIIYFMVNKLLPLLLLIKGGKAVTNAIYFILKMNFILTFENVAEYKRQYLHITLHNDDELGLK